MSDQLLKAQVLSDFALAINGVGYVGTANKIKIPEIKFQTIEKKLSGNASVTRIKTGKVEELKTEVEFSTFFGDEVYKLLSEGNSQTPLILNGALYEGNNTVAVKMTMQGNWDAINMGELSAGEGEVKMTLSGTLDLFTWETDGKEQIHIESIGNVVRINGEDKTAAARSILGL